MQQWDCLGPKLPFFCCILQPFGSFDPRVPQDRNKCGVPCVDLQCNRDNPTRTSGQSGAQCPFIQIDGTEDVIRCNSCSYTRCRHSIGFFGLGWRGFPSEESHCCIWWFWIFPRFYDSCLISLFIVKCTKTGVFLIKSGTIKCSSFFPYVICKLNFK